jgi:hypothetical protein
MQIINKIHAYEQIGRSWYQRPVKNITRITIHHDAIPNNGRFTDEEVLTNIMKEHISRGWAGASYHFWVSKGGNIYQLNNYTDITWHDGINSDSIGVCFNGYFHPTYNEKPTEKQLQAFKWLLNHLCTEHPEFPADFDDIRGHRERKSTACPGANFFPYVVEYREKEGNVSWGNITPSLKITLDIYADMSEEVEKQLGLTESWYTTSTLKKGSLVGLIKYFNTVLGKKG